MKKAILSLALLASFATIFSSMLVPDFMLMAKDGTLLITRSMEFGQDLNSKTCAPPLVKDLSPLLRPTISRA